MRCASWAVINGLPHSVELRLRVTLYGRTGFCLVKDLVDKIARGIREATLRASERLLVI